MIPFQPLTVIPAGAGSGKTFTLERTLGKWIHDRQVAPERVVAVTFTEAAAAELSRRVRTELLRAGLSEAALKLDQAYVSTIHGFGLRLLQEFAFEGGLTPRPRLLAEGEADALLRRALGRSTCAEPVLSDLARFGYTWTWGSDRSAEDVFRADILFTMSLLRSLDRGETGDALLDDAIGAMRDRHGPTSDGAALTDALHRAVMALLERFPHSLRDITTAKTARETFDKDHRALSRARDRAVLERDWALWQSLRALRQSMRGSPTPADYDHRADAVMEAANALPRHPGPLAQAVEHLTTLLETARDVLGRHAPAMRNAGLVDFTDMVALSYRLLLQSPQAMETLRRRVDCVVIDEFQDTNPIQFSLLWRLVSAGTPAVVVGDLKQGIMGFQGADPRLLQALMDRHPRELQPLTANWRSQPALMDIINRLGAGLFPDAYQPLDPRAKPVDMAPLEVLSFPDAPKRGGTVKAKDFQPAHIAVRLQALLADPDARVRDRRTGATRSLRGSDIAVLGPTHDHLKHQAEWLRAAGLRVRLQEGGWHASRAVQLALHTLDQVADPSDMHAALYLAATELGSLTLTEGLQGLCRGDSSETALTDRLSSVGKGPPDRTVGTLLREMVTALDLFAVVEAWPDGLQHRADLMRLLAEADAFDATPAPALQGLGLHGRDARVFRAWLAMKAEAGEDGRPPASVRDDDAITLTTWHAAKGREWPVVVVAGLDREIKVRLPTLSATYKGFDDLDDLLAQARLRWSPAFAAPESQAPFEDALRPGVEEEARRLLYVAVTRARDHLILAWPGYATGGKTTTHADLFARACGVSVDEAGLTISGQHVTCPVRLVPPGAPGLEPGSDAPSQQRSFGARAVHVQAKPATAILTPDSVRPSEGPTTPEAGPPATLVRYAAPLTVATALAPDIRGTLVHRCFEVLPRLDDPSRLARTLDPPLDEADLVAVSGRVRAFEDWLAGRFPDRTAVHRELPLLALDARGSVVNAVVDLVIETPSGAWIIDHKTGTPDDAAAAYWTYRPQLEAYGVALWRARPDLTLTGLAIHWPLLGVVTVSEP